MPSNKPDINRAHVKKYHGNNPVISSTYIEHKSVITNGINRIAENTFDLVKASPICHHHYPIPVIDSIFCLRVLLNKFSDDWITDHYHGVGCTPKLPIFLEFLKICSFSFQRELIHHPNAGNRASVRTQSQEFAVEAFSRQPARNVRHSPFPQPSFTIPVKK